MITNPVLSAADVTDQPGITSDYAHSIPAAISLLKSFSKVHPNALHVLRYLEGKAEREKRRRAEASPNDGYKHKIPTHLPPSIFAELRAKREEEKFSSVPLNQNETGHGQRRLWNRRWSMWSKPTWKRLTKSTNLPNDGHEENKEEKEEDNTPITARPSQQLEASKAKQTEATTSDIDARNEHETRGSLCVDSAKTHPTQPAPYNLRLRRSSRQLLDPFSLPSPKEPEYSEDAQDAAKGRHTPDHFCASPDPKPRKFTKVRHHRLGRGSTMPLHPTPFAAKPSNKDFESFEASTSDQSDCESPLERLQRAESIGSIKPQSGRSTSFTPEKAIDSDVETDLERFHDFGVDTDTEPEGRPATRCLVYDAFDGMPHPFWGTESEQSSWVSLPNQWKLEPECKVLQM